MKEKMKIFTIESGKVTEGVKVDSFTLKGAEVTIPAIIVGEEGRGRALGVLLVQLLPDSYKKWQEEGYVHINFAQAVVTKSGRPKLFQVEDADSTEKCICIFRTMIGFRGGNSHTGDRKDEYWVPNWFCRLDISALGKELKENYTKEEAIKIAEELNSAVEKYPWDVIFNKKLDFYPFPGEILSSGIIAQGDAGRMGRGNQYVAILPADTVFRTAYSGRLYGQPAEHYYIYREGQLLAVTQEERELSDIF